MKIATIELDNNEGKGLLFWQDGAIWCRRISDNDEWETPYTCEITEAIDVVSYAWSAPAWHLELIKT